LSQADLIKKLLEKFEDKIEKLKQYDTPTTASSHIMRCIIDQDGLSDEKQQEFHSGVESLLYLLKHSSPNLSNFLMDRANKGPNMWILVMILSVNMLKTGVSK
jgi:hypothetical protein